MSLIPREVESLLAKISDGTQPSGTQMTIGGMLDGRFLAVATGLACTDVGAVETCVIDTHIVDALEDAASWFAAIMLKRAA